MAQLTDSAQSIAARGEADETIRHLRANFEAERINEAAFWRIRNRLITILKMLMSLLNS